MNSCNIRPTSVPANVVVSEGTIRSTRSRMSRRRIGFSASACENGRCFSQRARSPFTLVTATTYVNSDCPVDATIAARSASDHFGIVSSRNPFQASRLRIVLLCVMASSSTATLNPLCQLQDRALRFLGGYVGFRSSLRQFQFGTNAGQALKHRFVLLL